MTPCWCWVAVRCPSSHLFSRLIQPSYPSLSSCHKCSSPSTLGAISFLVLEPKTQCSIWKWSDECYTSVNNPFLQSIGCATVHTSPELLDTFATGTHHGFMFRLLHTTTPGTLPQSCSPVPLHHSFPVQRLCSPRHTTLAILVFKMIE